MKDAYGSIPNSGTCSLLRNDGQCTSFISECRHIFGQAGEGKDFHILGRKAIGDSPTTSLVGLSQWANKQANTGTVDILDLTKIEAYDFRISTFCFFVSRIQWMLNSGAKVAL